MIPEGGFISKSVLLAVFACFAVSSLTQHLLAGSPDVSPKPKVSQTAAPGNCAGCHGEQKILPHGHSDTTARDGKYCKTCHTKDQASLRGKIPLSHIHLLAGISCNECHGAKEPPKPLETTQCLLCHESGDKLAQKTASIKPNPHESPHHDTGLDCDLCHRLHSKSKDFCAECHKFKFVLP